MKKFILIAALAIVSFVAQAQYTITATLAANAITNVFVGGIIVTEFTVNANAATAVVANLVDSVTNKLVYTIPAYQTFTKYPTNVSIIETNYWGAFQTNNFVALGTLTNNIAQNANALSPIVTSGSAPASGAVTYRDLNYRFWNGITLTNASGGSMTVTMQVAR